MADTKIYRNTLITAGYDYELFKVIDLIAKGTYGAVLKAKYASESKFFAIKIIDIEPSQKTSNKCELEILEELKKIQNKPSSLPTYYGYVSMKEKGVKKYKIFMDYMPGTLLNINKILDFEQIKSISFQLINGLAFLQNLNYCHRDLKPNNILCQEIDNNIIVKIIDFGISKKTDNYENQNFSINGTEIYLSPELRIAKHSKNLKLEINPFKSDVFSLGLVIFRLSCGKKGKELLFKNNKIYNNSLDGLKEEIKDLKNIFKQNYDCKIAEIKIFYKFIKKMLIIIPHNRPDFNDLFLKTLKIMKNNLKFNDYIYISDNTLIKKLNKKKSDIINSDENNKIIDKAFQTNDSNEKTLKTDNKQIEKEKISEKSILDKPKEFEKKAFQINISNEKTLKAENKQIENKKISEKSLFEELKEYENTLKSITSLKKTVSNPIPDSKPFSINETTTKSTISSGLNFIDLFSFNYLISNNPQFPDLYLSNVLPIIQEYDLLTEFSKYGNIKSISIKNNENYLTNIAFINYLQIDEAKRAKLEAPKNKIIVSFFKDGICTIDFTIKSKLGISKLLQPTFEFKSLNNNNITSNISNNHNDIDKFGEIMEKQIKEMKKCLIEELIKIGYSYEKSEEYSNKIIEKNEIESLGELISGLMAGSNDQKMKLKEIIKELKSQN